MHIFSHREGHLGTAIYIHLHMCFRGTAIYIQFTKMHNFCSDELHGGGGASPGMVRRGRALANGETDLSLDSKDCFGMPGPCGRS